MKEKELVIIMCPPYPEYETAPKDQSHCELFDCPKCKGQMWLSEKKKDVLKFASSLNKDILLGCYSCIKKLVEEDPSFFIQGIQVNL